MMGFSTVGVQAASSWRGLGFWILEGWVSRPGPLSADCIPESAGGGVAVVLPFGVC